MTGNNTILLNSATMMEAVRFYLEKEVFKDGDFTVTSVKEAGQRMAGMVDGFQVDISFGKAQK